MRLLAYATMLLGALCAAFGAIGWLPFFSPDLRLDLVGVALFVVSGSLIYLAGTRLQDRVRPDKTRTFVLKPGDTRFITAMLRRNARLFLILGFSLLAFDALTLLAALAPEGAQDESGPPWVAMALGIATLLLIAAVALAFLRAGFRLRNVASTRIYDVLTRTPHEVTGLKLTFIQKENAPGRLGRQILAEIGVGPEKLRAAVTEEQSSLLKQYIQLHNPRAAYCEVEQKFS